MKRRLNWYFMFSLIILLALTMNACSLNSDKDIIFIRHHLDDYSASTEPFEEGMAFTLTTDEIVEGMEEPRLLDTVYDTEVYLIKVEKREDRYLVEFGLDSELKSNGTMVSLFRLNSDQSYSRDLEYEVVNEKGETADIAYGGGDSDAPYEQSYHFKIGGAEVKSGEQWTFKLSGVYLLDYSKK